LRNLLEIGGERENEEGRGIEKGIRKREKEGEKKEGKRGREIIIINSSQISPSISFHHVLFCFLISFSSPF
jgi:hypothetical protein